ESASHNHIRRKVPTRGHAACTDGQGKSVCTAKSGEASRRETERRGETKNGEKQTHAHRRFRKTRNQEGCTCISRTSTISDTAIQLIFFSSCAATTGRLGR